MAPSFQQRLVLENGSVIFYHEGITATDQAFHFLIKVDGKKIPAYFEHLARQPFISTAELSAFGQMLHCGLGKSDEAAIEKILKIVDSTP